MAGQHDFLPALSKSDMLDVYVALVVHWRVTPPLPHYNRVKNLYPHWCQEAKRDPYDINTNGNSIGLLMVSLQAL